MCVRFTPQTHIKHSLARFTDGRCCPASLDSLTLTSVDISTHGPSEPRATNERVCGLPRSDRWASAVISTAESNGAKTHRSVYWSPRVRLSQKDWGIQTEFLYHENRRGSVKDKLPEIQTIYCSLATSHCCCFYMGVWDRLLVHVWVWMFSAFKVQKAD